jgi:hypothetical protein
MPKDHLALLRSESSASVENFIRNKTEIDLKDPLHQEDAPKSIDVRLNQQNRSESWLEQYTSMDRKNVTKIPTGLSMTSRMTFFHDRILGPECKLY